MGGRCALTAEMLVRLQFPQFYATRRYTMEVIRLDEEPVLKTGAGSHPLGVRVRAIA